MTLNDIFKSLTYGELSNLHLGGGEEGAINATNYESILNHVNLGLTALYSRFPLKEGALTIELQEGMFTYPLAKAYAATNNRSQEPVKFIRDTEEAPFSEDILKIERIYTDRHRELALNDLANPFAVMTPSANVIRVPPILVTEANDKPEELKTDTLHVVYRANHPILTVPLGYFDPDRVQMELPYTHLQALLWYVASRVNNPTGMSNEFHAGNSYYAKYEQECARLEQVNLRVDQISQVDRLSRMGWV